MINILRMDLQRFKTNRVMYVLLLVFVVFQIFGIFMMKQFAQPMEEGGVAVGSMNESEFIQFTLSQPPSWVMIYITVFSVYFYMSEYNAGFYKNYMTFKHARIHSVLSKALILALFTILMLVVMVISDLIGRGVFFGNVSIGDWGYLIKLLLGQMFLHWAYAIVIMCAAMFTRSILMSISIGLILVFNVFGMVIGVIETLIDGVNVSKYFLVNTIMSGLDYNRTADLIHIFCVAIVCIVLFTIVAVKYKVKEDLR